MTTLKVRPAPKGKATEGLALPSAAVFLIATGQDSIRPDAKARKIIRSHVMKGKKSNRPSRRGRLPNSWVNGSGDSPFGDGPKKALVQEILGLEPRMLHLLYDFVPVMVKVMYPIERCVDIGLESQHWHDDLAHDPCYAQSVSEIAGVYFDITRSPNSYLQMLLHLDSALGPLRNSLADTDVVVTDSMIFLVVSLALVSQSFDELDGALTHLRGLHQLIKLRGGVTALAHKRSLQIKCCRVDLALAMRTGDRPLFFTRDNISWKPYLANVSKSLPPPWQSLVSAPDIRLVNVFLDLREFTTSINLAHQTQRKIPPSLFQEVLISVQYRLQHLSYAINDKQETLRLAMLAFSTTLFLEAHSAPLYCKSLSCLLREALRVLGQGNDCTELELKLWLFFVGRISILNLPEDQSWLEARVLKINEALGLTTWAEVRSVLKGFLWVDIVHGKAGEMIFKRLDTATPG